MATIQRTASAADQKRIFIGSAWKNIAKAESAHAGTEFLSVRLLPGMTVNLSDHDNIMLWPIERRGAKSPDYNLSVAVEEAVTTVPTQVAA